MFTCRFYLSEVFRLSSAQSSIMLSSGDVFQLKEIFIIVNTSSDHNNDEALEVYRFSFAYTLDAMPTRLHFYRTCMLQYFHYLRVHEIAVRVWLALT